MERDREGEIEGERDIKEEFLGDARDSEQDRKLYLNKMRCILESVHWAWIILPLLSSTSFFLDTSKYINTCEWILVGDF